MWQAFSRFVVGEPTRTELPQRGRETIARQQENSEILIGWAQLTLVVLFGVLYAISPKTSPMMGFEPVPVALALYLLFTVGRLAIACKRKITSGVLMASIVMDISLLMFLIWTFHIQYEQPPSFYLKAPTMLYVFIFIGLRALRFDPRYILATGAAAVAGWGILMTYVMVSNPQDAMITRNYVEYMTSNAILVGAEIDKMVSIIVVTVVLAVAVTRAQRLLNQAVVDSTLAHDLSRFVSREVADHIAESDTGIQPGDGESRIATVMFTDIEGFSTFSEKLSPENLVKVINDYFAVTGGIVAKYGGVIVQFEGDAMLVTFNTVTPDEDHAANAVRAAIEIEQAMETEVFNGIKLKTRCGINTGEMVIGAIGTQERLVF
ncbi:MAG: adenylate/guanylate cyclase domain-containing protein, partial [Rhodospirillales bacterium]|nr:adenylate/guanylate cyclase domain-containing protein [Rhodospirillales bacterium]